MKTIEINSCEDCPHISHTGALQKGGSKHCCGHPITVKNLGADCNKRVIPYKSVWVESIQRSIRKPKKIPKFCPL